jgi:hypothetical protein
MQTCVDNSVCVFVCICVVVIDYRMHMSHRCIPNDQSGGGCLW